MIFVSFKIFKIFVIFNARDRIANVSRLFYIRFVLKCHFFGLRFLTTYPLLYSELHSEIRIFIYKRIILLFRVTGSYKYMTYNDNNSAKEMPSAGIRLYNNITANERVIRAHKKKNQLIAYYIIIFNIRLLSKKEKP